MSWTYLMLSAAIAGLDEAVKKRIPDPPVKNTGFAMNRMGRHQGFVAAVSVVMTAGCMAELIFGKHADKLGLSLVLGGALSNTYDRVVRKYVVDYLPAGRVYYNLSDMAIFAGFAVLIMKAFSEGELGEAWER